MTDWKIIQGDVQNVLDDLDDESFDGCFTDPPYGLTDGFDVNKVMQKWLETGDYDDDKKGFMGKKWDNVPGPIVWKKIKNVVKPGANVFSFSGTRTSDLISIAMRLGGLVRFDSIAWQYGSGFPKSHDISKNIDRIGGEFYGDSLKRKRKQMGLSREDVAKKVGCTKSSIRDWEKGRAREDGGSIEKVTPSNKYRDKLKSLFDYPEDKRQKVGKAKDRRGDGTNYGLGHSGVLKEGGYTSKSEKWDGWGTALKPSREDILCFRKPRDGTYVDNALEHGVSGINIDDCRIPVDDSDPNLRLNAGDHDKTEGVKIGQKGMSTSSEESTQDMGYHSSKGRFPTNTILSHHPECGVKCHKDCAVRRMDESSGELHKRGNKTETFSSKDDLYGFDKCSYRKFDGGKSGGASRFFYTSKAQKSEREAGLLDFREKKETGSYSKHRSRRMDEEASRFDGSDTSKRKNHHPTVKPVDLCKWVTTLIGMPPHKDSKRKLLIPFAGVGSEMIGAMLSGYWDEIVGIELQQEYVDIARKRIEWWEEHGDDAVEHHKSTKKRKKEEQETGQTNINDLLGD